MRRAPVLPVVVSLAIGGCYLSHELGDGDGDGGAHPRGDAGARSHARTHDLDGDGYDDVAVGAPAADDRAGVVYVYRGRAGGLGATPSAVLVGPAGGWLGYSIAIVGDIEADGYDDLVAGAPFVETSTGLVSVYDGAPGGVAPSPTTTVPGPFGTLASFGSAVAGAGDVTGDGLADVLVAANSAEPARVQLYVGARTGLVTSPLTTIRGPDNRFAYYVAGAGDVDGDGHDDVLVDRWTGLGYDHSQVGLAYLYRGGVTGLEADPATTIRIADDATHWDSGGDLCVSWAGDVNADGYDDVILGDGYNLTNPGRAYLHLGGPTGLATDPAVILHGGASPSEYDFLTAAGAGDVNADGYDDVVVGSVDGRTGRGRVDVYLGGAGGLASAPAASIGSPTGSVGFGASVGAAGDVNGDGYDDVIVGAPGDGTTTPTTGHAYLFVGSPVGVGTSPAATLDGPGSFGASVAAADIAAPRPLKVA